VDDLIEFLRARLDDDEQVARAAGGDRWVERMGDVTSEALDKGDYGPRGYWVASASFSCEGEAEALHEGHAAHIARHDPARVLAEVDAKRRILDEVVDEATGLDMSVDGDRRVGSRDTTTEPYLGTVLLRLLALPYADHPDYREEWRP
jgi:hypothetical protein